jgi:hypothetical protein
MLLRATELNVRSCPGSEKGQFAVSAFRPMPLAIPRMADPPERSGVLPSLSCKAKWGYLLELSRSYHDPMLGAPCLGEETRN